MASIELKNNDLTVTGELNFNSVPGVWQQSQNLISKSPALNFDFAAVSVCNSGALALMIEWMKYAREHNKTISFKNIPAQLQSLIAVSNVSQLLQ